MCRTTLNWPLLSVYFLSFSSFASISLIAPFFPSEASDKGMSISLAGCVLSISEVVLIVMNAITGKILPVVGSRITLTTGIVVVGVSNIIFGLLHDINNSELFMVLCFIVRAIEGTGTAFLLTTSYLILMKKCGDNLSRAVAINEACISIGLAVGPPLGSLFYAIGGYKLPFLIIGTSVLLNVPFSLCLLEDYRDISVDEQQGDSEQRLSYLRLFSMPKVIVVCFPVFVVGSNSGAIFSTLELYLKSYEIGPKSIGFMFMLTTGSFTAFSLIISRFYAPANGFRYIRLGLFLNILVFMIIGPSPFFVLQGSLVVTGFALFLLGAGSAFALIPTMPTILQLASIDGYPESMTNSSYVSGLWTMVNSIGTTIGPYLGAALLEYFNSEVMFTVIAMMNLVCFFISLTPLLGYCNTAETRREGYNEIDGIANGENQ